MVHAEDGIAVFVADVLLLLGCVAVDVSMQSSAVVTACHVVVIIILDETVGLFFSDEVEVIEERRARESVHRRVLGGRSDREESGSADPKEGGKRGHCDNKCNERPN